MKKILSALVALSMLCSMIILPASATTALPEDYTEGYVYEYQDFSTEVPSNYTLANSYIETVDGEDVLHVTAKGATSGGMTFPVITNRNATEEDAVAGLNDLVLEYRVKIPATNESQSYFGYYNGSSTQASTVIMSPVSYGYRNGMLWATGYPDTAAAELESLAEWHTVSIVYPADDPVHRILYIDGVSYGESIDIERKESGVMKPNAYANVWAQLGKTSWRMYMYSKNGTANTYLDYVKVYEAASHFTADIDNSNSVSPVEILVSFNNAVGSATISAEDFSITGESTVSVKNIERIDEDTYKLIPSETLKAGATYTLNIGEVKDNLANEIATKEISFTTGDKAEYIEGEELYYNSFDESLDFARIVTAGDEIVYGIDTTSDGISVFRAQGTDVYQNNGNFGFISPAISAANGPDELVLEYKVRVNADGPHSYLGTWKGAKRSKAVDMARNIDYKDKLFFHYADKEPIPGDYTFNPKEWNTIAIVYPKNRQSRDIYINGEYFVTSAEGAEENTYASAGETAFGILPDFQCSDDLLEMDYYKFTDISLEFDAKLLNADASSAIIEFNTTPVNLTPDSFTLSDGTAVSSIKALTERTYMLTFEDDLAAGAYSISVAGIKDTLGRNIYRDALSFTTTSGGSEEFVYAYEGFTADPTYSEVKTNTTIRKVTNSEGLDVLKLANESGKADGYGCNHEVYVWSDANRPTKYVIEYKVKVTSANSSAYFRTNKTYLDAVELMYGSTKTYPNYEVMSNTSGFNEWKTISMIYDTEAKTRDVYINGELFGKNVANAVDYKTKDSVSVRFQIYMRAAGNYTEVDYVKIYAPADKFTAEVDSVSEDLKTFHLDFNGTVGEISPEMIKIGGQTPASITLVDDEEQIYAATIANALKTNTDYTVSINGVTSALGQKTYDVVSFKTRAAKEVDVTASVNNSAAGTVEINGVEGVAGKVLENSDAVLTVKPYINYKATVTVNGEALFVDRFDKYTIRNVTEDTNVSVEFTEVTEEEAAGQAIETIYNPYVDNISMYAFGVLRRNSDDFGIIVSTSKDNLTMEAVNAGNAQKFKADEANAFGEYGVRIIDVGKKLGSAIYMAPYAVYGDTVVYGRTVGATR